MSWTRKQIVALQIYRRAAGLADGDYRALIESVCGRGVRSSRDPTLTQYEYDHVMAHIEAKLEYRIREGFVPPPPRRRIRDLRYWRNRLPRKGGMNSRQRHRILALWEELRPRLPESARCMQYLAGIAEQASGYRVHDFWELRAFQAALLIEALKDRLAYAIREVNRA